jgi:DNA-binding transcriptional LysR family regulator
MRNLQGLISFVESAACGSFTSAAAKLGITPAAVGKNVGRLEREIGVRLLQRTTRHLRLTAEGSAFLAEAADALNQLDRAVSRVSKAIDAPSGLVRLTSSVSFGRRFVLPALSHLTRRCPELNIEIDLENRVVDLVRDGIDIAVRGGLFSDSTLIARRVAPIISVLVASPSYLRQRGVPQRVSDLSTHDVMGIRFSRSDTLPWHFRRAARRGVEEWLPHAKIWTSDPDALLDLAVAGAGVSQAGLMYAAPLLRRGQLKIVLGESYLPGDRYMAVCYPNRQLLSRRVEVVVDELIDVISKERDAQLRLKDVPTEWLAR